MRFFTYTCYLTVTLSHSFRHQYTQTLLRIKTDVHGTEMGNLHYRLNFDPGKTKKIVHHSLKEHVKMSKIAKFGSEML